MAAKTTAQAGDWNTGATWTGGVKPSFGDSATINHNVTVSTPSAVGTSGVAGTVDLTIANGITFTIQSGGLLTLRGDTLQNNNSTIDVQGGGTWRFDSSASASPGTTSYVCQIGSAHGTTSVFKTTGTSGNRAIVTSVLTSGALPGRFTDGGFLQGGNMTCDFATFTSIGNSTNNGFNCSIGAGQTTYFRDCIFDTCGKMGSTFNLNATSNFDMQRCCWKNSPGKVFNIANGGTYTSGTRLMHQNVFDNTLDFFSPLGWTVTENYFDTFFSTIAGDFVSFANNHVRMTSATGGIILYGPVSNNNFLFDEAGATNAHFIQTQSTMTISGNVFEFTGNDGTGDCIVFGNPGSASTVTIQNNVYLPNAAGENSGTPFSALGNANLTFAFNHNTYFCGTQGAAVGETYAGHAGLCSSFKSNIAHDTSARGYLIQDSGVNDATTDLVSSANLDYNCAYNTLAGSNGHGANNLEFSSGSGGANNKDVNPQFYNSARDAAAYDAACGGPGTVANLRTEMKKRNDTGFNSAYTPTAIVAWIKDGFRVGNAALQNAGHDGATIGALEYFTSSSGARNASASRQLTIRRRRR